MCTKSFRTTMTGKIVKNFKSIMIEKKRRKKRKKERKEEGEKRREEERRKKRKTEAGGSWQKRTTSSGMYVSISFSFSFLSFFLSLLRFFFKPGDYNKRVLFQLLFSLFSPPSYVYTYRHAEREFGSFGPDVGNVGDNG